MADPPKNLYAALLAAQKAMGPVKKDATNPHFRNKYASLEAVMDTIDDPLHANGLMVLQRIDVLADGAPILRTEIVHAESGEKVESVAPLVCKDPDNPQAVAGAVTYFRRYSLLALLGLVPEDDDGNTAAAPRTRAVDFAETRGRRIAAVEEEYDPGPPDFREPAPRANGHRGARPARPASDAQMNFIKSIGKRKGAATPDGHTDIPVLADLLFSQFRIKWDGTQPLAADDAKRVLDAWAPQAGPAR